MFDLDFDFEAVSDGDELVAVAVAVAVALLDLGDFIIFDLDLGDMMDDFLPLGVLILLEGVLLEVKRERGVVTAPPPGVGLVFIGVRFVV